MTVPKKKQPVNIGETVVNRSNRCKYQQKNNDIIDDNESNDGKLFHTTVNSEKSLKNIINTNQHDRCQNFLMSWTIFFRKILFSLSILFLIYFYQYFKYQQENVASLDDNIMAAHWQQISNGPIGQILPCSNDYDLERQQLNNENDNCLPKKCGRFVTDAIITDQESLELRLLAENIFSLIEPSGGVAIFDLITGALSNGSQFINFYKLMSNDGNYSIPKEKFNIFETIKDKIINSIAISFGISANRIHLTRPAFFTRITSKPDRTLNDQYWHEHVDRNTYDGFVYTSLLYLATFNQHFNGGRFIFLDANNKNITVEPRFGRVLFFTSGSENRHLVEKVTNGQRFALTIPFTCDRNKVANVGGSVQ